MKQLPFNLEIYALPGIWNLTKDEDYFNTFFDNCRECNIKFITVFPFQHEPNGLYNKFSPFERVGGVYDLSKWDEEWWESITRLLHIANKKNIILVPVLFSKYNEFPFKKNIQNKTFWQGSCAKYQNKYVRRLMRVWDNKYRGFLFHKAKWIRLSNELSHPSHYAGARRSLYHEAWYDNTLGTVPLKRTICDVSHSDFAKLDDPHTYFEFEYAGKRSTMLVGHLSLDDINMGFYWSTKGGVIWIPDPVGVENIAHWGKEKYERKYWIEWHDVSPTTLNLPHEKGAKETLLEVSIRVNYNNLIFSTDGNSKGTGPLIPRTPFRVMTSSELRTLCLIAKSHPKRVRVHYLPMGLFEWRDNVLTENLDNLDWDKLSIPNEVFNG